MMRRKISVAVGIRIPIVQSVDCYFDWSIPAYTGHYDDLINWFRLRSYGMARHCLVDIFLWNVGTSLPNNRYQIAEDHNLNTHHRENLRSYQCKAEEGVMYCLVRLSHTLASGVRWAWSKARMIRHQSTVIFTFPYHLTVCNFNWTFRSGG
jgi:hypothetical protein